MPSATRVNVKRGRVVAAAMSGRNVHQKGSRSLVRNPGACGPVSARRTGVRRATRQEPKWRQKAGMIRAVNVLPVVLHVVARDSNPMPAPLSLAQAVQQTA